MRAYLKGFSKQSFEKFPAFLRSKKEAPSERRVFEPTVQKGFFSEGKKDPNFSRSKKWAPSEGRLFLSKKEKGISPIIASVLLILFSTAIAVFVGTWAMNYTQTQLSGLELCSKVEIIYSNFDFDPVTKEGTMTLQNIGASIEGYRIYAFVDVNQKELVKEVETHIKKSEKKTEKFGTDLDNVRGIIIEVINCPGVRLMIPIN